MLIDNLPHKCTIRRRTRTKGTLGGSKDSSTNEQTNVECWEQPASDSEVLFYQKQGMSITHAVYFTTQQTLTTRHQILITERQGVAVSSPVVLEVVSAGEPDATAGLGLVWKVMCNRITSRTD